MIFSSPANTADELLMRCLAPAAEPTPECPQDFQQGLLNALTGDTSQSDGFSLSADDLVDLVDIE